VGASTGGGPDDALVRFALVLLIVTSALVFAASGIAGARPTSTLRADVAEWSIVPSTGAVHAGRVRLVVHNFGATVHQVTVARTATFGARLRLSGSRALARSLGTSVLVPPGRTVSLVVSLKRGSYVLFDNLPWSYWKGTSVAFSVR
jgi:uncharacterized cupredoxin-like copper-binding protein